MEIRKGFSIPPTYKGGLGKGKNVIMAFLHTKFSILDIIRRTDIILKPTIQTTRVFIMGLRLLGILLISCFFWLSSWVITPPATALTSIKLSNLSYQPCPGNKSEGSVTSGDIRPAKCFEIKGKAKNISGKIVYDADVFGRIYDANDNPTMENRGRIGTIEELPPGVSDFSIQINVPANQPTPLKLKQFKASGFAGKVRPYYYDDFEYDG